ncbi:hypothetical protein NQT63_02010 [Pseudoalteromonas agarivorans]|uniref:hypothetical protein n=1 Tax=Pseudoalteromonas agarivorans TaxID=176102 RepID=UPI002118983B|nr:hypothetical protein [Pseudoalteromonas agarivorans]MCQ8884467.1 hypothetical protein [Pseudoalteromonas agarivorans]
MAASAGAWYRVGTVNVTKNNATVTGVGSSWQSDVIAIAIGDAFTIDAKTWYEVIAVDSDTSITLDRGFEGTTANGVDYAILRNTSGTILTRIAGQIAVQFNQKQLFLDELRNWLTSDDETTTLTDSHGISYAVKTLSKIQEITGTAATKDVVVTSRDSTIGRVVTIGSFGWGSPDAGETAPVDFSERLPMGSHPVHILDSVGDKPETNGFGTVFAIAGTSGNTTHQLYFSRNIVDDRFKYRTKRNGSVDYDEWVTVFDSVNSVNPLDYGLGSPQRNLTTNIDDANLGKGFYATIGGESAAAGKFPAGFSKFGSFIHSGYDPLNQLQIYADIFEDKIAFRRLKTDPTETEWAEFYHSGNTDFNELGGSAEEQLGAIVNRNSTSVFMVKDISGPIEAPTSITCTGTFKITNQAGADVITGIPSSDLSLDPLTSSKRLKIRISNVDTSLLSFHGVNATYELTVESDVATIRKNY